MSTSFQRWVYVPLWLAACAGAPGHTLEPAASPAVPQALVREPGPFARALAAARQTAIAAASAPAPAPAAESPYGAEIQSVRFLRPTVLRRQPSIAAAKVGIIGRDVHARPVRAAPAGHGCAARWIEIAPRGWTCETQVVTSTDPPASRAAPSLSEDDEDDERPVVPGVYGVVRTKDAVAYASRADALAGENARTLVGSTSVRARAVVRIDGQRYWVTTTGELIEASAIATFSPSRFRGVALDATTALPLAWAYGRAKPRAPIVLRARPARDAEIVGELPPRAVAHVAERSADGKFVRLDDAGWAARADVRIADTQAPPEGTGGDERWFDVDLDDQVLVAYEGDRPAYATLVSTGKRDHRTPVEVARVVAKHERATMASDKRDLYSVADVPWTMYYDHDYALHTAYWHDGFGTPRSHGCVNLAPRDARALYHWSSPDVPPGWTAVYGDVDTPGSLVRVRSRALPEPSFRGYARQLRERAVRTAAQ